jgi:hypothetical protein
MTKPNYVFLKSLELVCRGSLEMLRQTRKSLECCKQSQMGDSGGSLDDQCANRTADSKDSAYNAIDVNGDAIGN